jgi:Flp pilus assembly pilin Flp
LGEFENPVHGREIVGRKEINMKRTLVRLWKEDRGQDLTEYALLLVLLTLAAVTTLNNLANAINGVFTNAITSLNT